ncbi:hypothetical protein SJA_C1-00880 [Sphingobium indicum UT26S]|uniref:Uncharacterized protein n=1 Tax=Sphingobium indicum (strain DSM 16413 / CCM 7287 / MTCC 6362 / UT26 / NBRC 101211 / UT26S) TaxID=452662 RepID=D4YX40_SPHIU|nr:hypothetical protein SJA_C1-00880 [Sphingobium indicum UT26S]
MGDWGVWRTSPFLPIERWGGGPPLKAVVEGNGARPPNFLSTSAAPTSKRVTCLSSTLLTLRVGRNGDGPWPCSCLRGSMLRWGQGSIHHSHPCRDRGGASLDIA